MARPGLRALAGSLYCCPPRAHLRDSPPAHLTLWRHWWQCPRAYLPSLPRHTSGRYTIYTFNSTFAFLTPRHPAGKKKSHGWCDFAPGSAVSDTRQGYAVNDTLMVAADILVLNESVSFTRETELASSAAGGALISVLPSAPLPSAPTPAPCTVLPGAAPGYARGCSGGALWKLCGPRCGGHRGAHGPENRTQHGPGRMGPRGPGNRASHGPGNRAQHCSGNRKRWKVPSGARKRRVMSPRPT